MKQFLYLMVVSSIVLTAATGFCIEPEADSLMGTVVLGSKLKPDAKGRKGVAAIAAKIMKMKGAGSVRLRGDFPGAENEEDYLYNSVILAREIEQQLKPLLKNRFQIYLMASKYSGEKKSDPNSVEIFFYPRELRVEGSDALRHISTLQKEIPKDIAVPKGKVEDKVEEAVEEVYEPIEAVPERAEAEDRSKGSKKMMKQQESEDPTLANELVNKVKARAAERARRQARESAAPQ